MVRRFIGQISIEWGFVAVLLLLCGVLTVLQYRWTGEVSRAETMRLRVSLAAQAQALADAFDTDLAQSCRALLPSRAELREMDCADAFVTRYRQWRASHPQPLFRRVAIAVPLQGTVELFVPPPEQETSKALRIEWPGEWSVLREFVTRMVNGGRPRLDDRSGEFLEFPIFGGRSGSGAAIGERGWLLVQLDLDHIRGTWMPELVRAYLGTGDTFVYDVVVSEAATKRILFSTAGDAPSGGEVLFTTPFHRDGISPVLGNSAARGPSGGGFPGRRVGQGEGLWALEVRQRPGALESLVDASRRRNLSVALLVNGLIVAAGGALAFQTRRSRQLAEAQMNFVATVSHELRTPLTVIRGAGHNLLRGVVKDRSRIEDYAKLIIEHADQLKELTEQTLAIAGCDRNGVVLARVRVDIRTLLGDVVAGVVEETRAAGIEVHLESSPDLRPVCGDPAALRRAFQNLIGNAVKHGGDGRWMGVTAANVPGSRPPMVEVRVDDRGQGIPAAEQAEVFKPFFRGATARSRQVRGSGLGLSVVRQIVAAHDGSVSVQSTPGSGTKFTVHLPAES